MKNFLNKYRIQIHVAAIIIWTILAVLKWIEFSETGKNMSTALIWSILALYYILKLITMKINNKLADQGSLNNSNNSAE